MFKRIPLPWSALAFLICALTWVSGISTKAATVAVAWDPSPDSSVAGYSVYYGLASGDYMWTMDAGTNTTVTVDDLSYGTTYYFAVLAYDTNNEESPFSNEITDTTAEAISILVQPVSQTIIAGNNATLAVIAESDLTSTFQWYEGTTAISAATNAALSLANVSDASSGIYSVVISNSAGNVTSSLVALSVIDPPVITSAATPQSVPAGSSVHFTVAVSGTGPFTFQWYKAGIPIDTGTKETLNLANVSTASSGRYFVTVQNAAGEATSARYFLTVTNGLFTALAGAYNGLFYQTNGNNADIAVQTSGMLSNCVVGPAGNYSGTIYLEGAAYPLAGTFNSEGTDTEILSEATNGYADLSVTLQMDMSGASQMITGSVSNMDSANSWTAPLLADQETNSGIVPGGAFEMVILSASDAADSLPNSYISIVSTGNGFLSLSGYLSDWTPVSETVAISGAGTFPFFCSLYGGAGVIEGWINFANGWANGSVTWIRPPGINFGVPYPLGFTNTASVY